MRISYKLNDKGSLALEKITFYHVYFMVPLLCLHVHMCNPKLKFVHQKILELGITHTGDVPPTDSRSPHKLNHARDVTA